MVAAILASVSTACSIYVVLSSLPGGGSPWSSILAALPSSEDILIFAVRSYSFATMKDRYVYIVYVYVYVVNHVQLFIV